MKLVKNENEINKEHISDKEAEEAFVKILKWMGENPEREGLLETPKRVVKAFKEYFSGYRENPRTSYCANYRCSSCSIHP
jgi:GTP cyclohydrolase I